MIEIIEMFRSNGPKVNESLPNSNTQYEIILEYFERHPEFKISQSDIAELFLVSEPIQRTISKLIKNQKIKKTSTIQINKNYHYESTYQLI